jgi:hypothetical protein
MSAEPIVTKTTSIAQHYLRFLKYEDHAIHQVFQPFSSGIEHFERLR